MNQCLLHQFKAALGGNNVNFGGNISGFASLRHGIQRFRNRLGRIGFNRNEDTAWIRVRLAGTGVRHAVIISGIRSDYQNSLSSKHRTPSLPPIPNPFPRKGGQGLRGVVTTL